MKMESAVRRLGGNAKIGESRANGARAQLLVLAMISAAWLAPSSVSAITMDATHLLAPGETAGFQDLFLAPLESSDERRFDGSTPVRSVAQVAIFAPHPGAIAEADLALAEMAGSLMGRAVADVAAQPAIPPVAGPDSVIRRVSCGEIEWSPIAALHCVPTTVGETAQSSLLETRPLR